MRAPLLISILLAGIAFSAAWGVSRLTSDRAGKHAQSGTPSPPPGELLGPLHSSTAGSGVRPVPADVLHDALLRQALEEGDLIAGVKEIMAREQEDHCADTRLICLVEELPAARLGELPRVLESFLQNEFVLRFVLGAWAQRDAAGALAWVQAHPALGRTGVHAFLRGWTRAAPEAALAWVDAQPFSSASAALRTAVVEGMSEKNPAAAMELMRSRGWLAENPAAVLRLLHNWGGSDPGAALGALRGLAAEMGLKLKDAAAVQGYSHDSQSFRVMLGALLNGAFDRNPADAAALLAQFSPEELASGGEAIASEVLARDPVACEALFTANPDAQTRVLLRALAERNPGLALTNLTRLQDPELQAELLLAATSYRGGSEAAAVPEAARPAVMALLNGMTDEKQRVQTAGRLCAQNAATAPAWAAELWASLPADQQSQNGHQFFQRAAGADAEIALQMYRASPLEVQTQNLKSLCSGMAATKPAQALDLVLHRTEPELRAECAATLFAYWAGAKPDAALAALEQNAARLDLQAVLEQLPAAGQFKTASGSAWETVDAKRVAEKIRQLLGSEPPPVPAR